MTPRPTGQPKGEPDAGDTWHPTREPPWETDPGSLCPLRLGSPALGSRREHAALMLNAVVLNRSAETRATCGWRGLGKPCGSARALTGRRFRPRLPPRTIRVRLAALFFVVFLVSGAALLALTDHVWQGRSSSTSSSGAVRARGREPAAAPWSA